MSDFYLNVPQKLPQCSDEVMTDVILGLVNSYIFFYVFSSLMIDLAELEKEQKVDEVKALRLTSFLKTIKYGVSNCAMRTAEEDRGSRRVQGLCCLFKSSVSHVSSSLCPQWFMLEDVASGKLHLRLEWLSPLSTPEKLDEVRKLWFLRRVLLETSEYFSAKTKLSLTILVFFPSSVSGADEHQSSAWSSQRRPVFGAARCFPGLCQEPACKSCPISQHAPAQTLLYQSGQVKGILKLYAARENDDVDVKIVLFPGGEQLAVEMTKCLSNLFVNQCFSGYQKLPKTSPSTSPKLKVKKCKKGTRYLS